MFETTFLAISKLKSLTHLAMRISPSYGNIDFVFEVLTELQALEINGLDETAIIGITRYCKKLEHLSARDDYEIIPVDHANILRMASLPNLCSLVIYVDYAEEQTTELVNRLIAKGNLQVIKMITSDKPVELLFEILRQCKRIRIISLNFGLMDSELYSKICQVVDEVDERGKQEFPEEAHPMVEMEYCGDMSADMREPHKWFRLTDKDSPHAAFEQWEYGWLSAGKPDWATLHLSGTANF